VALLAPAYRAWASHHRGVDAWADIETNGVVRLYAKTRRAKGALSVSEYGVDPRRFGNTQFQCSSTGEVFTLSPAAGMRVVGLGPRNPAPRPVSPPSSPTQ
jgi:hypothetical protein